MSVKKKIGKAAFLLIFRKGWSSALNLIVMMYLARELDPSSFGLLAISSVFVTLIFNLGVSGIGDYIVYYKGDDWDDVCQSAFWLNLFLTIVVCGIVVLVAPFWSNFYSDPRIVNIVYFLTIGFFAEMLTVIPVAIFRKSIKFEKLIFLQTIFGTLTGIGKVGFAFWGFGVYSLVLPIAIIQPILAVATIVASDFRPSMKINFFFWKSIVAYTKHIIGGRILTRIVNEGDNILVGKFLGLQELGYYTLAFQLSNIFTNTLLPIISTLSLPVFSGTPETQLKANYLKMINLISSISIPLLLLMVILGEPIILLFYGHQWIAAILPLQILCLFTIFRSITSPTSAIFNAMGKPQIGFYYSLIFMPFFLFSIWVGSYWGLIGVCICVTMTRVIGGQVTLYISSKLLKFNVFEIYKLLLPYVASSILAGVLLMLLIGRIVLPLWIELLLYGFLFGVVYFWVLRILFVRQLTSLTIMINGMSPALGRIMSRVLFVRL